MGEYIEHKAQGSLSYKYKSTDSETVDKANAVAMEDTNGEMKDVMIVMGSKIKI